MYHLGSYVKNEVNFKEKKIVNYGYILVLYLHGYILNIELLTKSY